MSESNTGKNSRKSIWNKSKVLAFVLPRGRFRINRTQTSMSRRQSIRQRAFVLEAGGRAVLAFSADSIRQATDFCAQEWFTADLGAYRSNGQPIWDGASELKIRGANAGEAAKLEAALETERARGEHNGYIFPFLVPVDALPQ